MRTLLARLDDPADTDEAGMTELPGRPGATDVIRIEGGRSCVEPCVEPPTYVVGWMFDVEDEEGILRDS